jgi:hypothetical protein
VTGSRAAVGVAALTAAVLAPGCGIADDREPRVITAERAPLDLNPNDDELPSGGSSEVTLFFVFEGQLVAVDRATESDTPDVAIQALLGGPAEGETVEEPTGEMQLTTRIPAETQLRGLSITGNVADIDLGCAAEAVDPAACGLLGVGGTDQLIMFAQLACTADDFRAIAGVRFLQEGQPQQAPLPDGPLTSEPVRCLDYRALQEER